LLGTGGAGIPQPQHGSRWPSSLGQATSGGGASARATGSGRISDTLMSETEKVETSSASGRRTFGGFGEANDIAQTVRLRKQASAKPWLYIGGGNEGRERWRENSF